jgi:hypothetical protein
MADFLASPSRGRSKKTLAFDAVGNLDSSPDAGDECSGKIKADAQFK